MVTFRNLRRMAALGSLLACPILAEQAIDFSKLGPAIGHPMPHFEAADQDGESHNLKDLLGPKGAILLFFRSADW